MTADFWFTAWVDAGQPNLNELLKNSIPEAEPQENMEREDSLKIREHEGP